MDQDLPCQGCQMCDKLEIIIYKQKLFIITLSNFYDFMSQTFFSNIPTYFSGLNGKLSNCAVYFESQW